MKYVFSLGLLVITVAFLACNNNSKPDQDPAIIPPPSGIPAPATLNYAIISEFPHDTAAFTEGLELHDGKLYESGGDYIYSVLQYGDYKTGVIKEKNKMGTDKIFGEGITILNGKIYQLTYTTNIVYVYNINDIKKPIKTFNWPYQGWGMTNNGTDLIIDVGNANLYFVDPETFKVKSTLAVMDNKGPVNNINELEYVNGFIWANVWMTNRIIKIDAESGHVVAEFYLNNIASPDGNLQVNTYENSDVMNGIAYDSTTKSLLITGKRWPKLYEVRIN